MIGINTYRCTRRHNNDDNTYNNYIIHNVNDCLKSKENQLGSWFNKSIWEVRCEKWEPIRSR